MTPRTEALRQVQTQTQCVLHPPVTRLCGWSNAIKPYTSHNKNIQSIFFNLWVSSPNRRRHYKKWLTVKVPFLVYWVQSVLFINPTGLMLQQQSVSVSSTSKNQACSVPRCVKDATLCPDAPFFFNSLDLGQRTCKNVTFWCEMTLSQFTHLKFPKMVDFSGSDVTDGCLFIRE